ncbi:DUF2782 domain-containing protein [Wenzhouxiangella marina]|uniref:Uncharacterized protein n=1 Tax=Wenzhouxiangella marina TaxID=1579979 RepID=A0A0K0XZ94_9GAMM|nr:DUF2782 domain-containing protein [Wenzhouxiangella marina]AKS42941.1 hypothetical protein WM2015_2583 [Wenzhouxiangella marina]MBB6087375.1 hypothetical protein [Wenzhouxiangella marina]
MKMRAIPLLALLLAAPLYALQSEAPPPPPIPEPEPLPPKVQDPDEQVLPEVNIRREEDRDVEEYSINGVVYMIRIVPDVGPAYYLIDTTGDGNFDSQMQHDQLAPVRPAHWKIREW